jgi:hypothetical protein
MNISPTPKPRHPTSLLDYLTQNKLITPKMRRITLFYRTLMRGALAIMGAPSLKRPTLLRVDQSLMLAIEPTDRTDAIWVLHCWHHLCKLISNADREILRFYAEAIVSDQMPSLADNDRFFTLLTRLEDFYKQAKKMKKEMERNTSKKKPKA